MSEWRVETTDAFAAWFSDRSVNERVAIAATIEMLKREGPRLGFPQSSAIRGARTRHLRELRVQSGGRPIRIFYAFDPRRVAILLVGGDKSGKGRFYERLVARADDLYDAHLRKQESGARKP